MLSARSTLGLALLLVLTIAAATPLHAQISVKATPYSFRANLIDDAPSYTLTTAPRKTPAPYVRQHDDEGLFFVPPAQPGLETPVALGFDNAGRWTPLPDGGRLWQLRLASEGTASLHLVYDDFWMPPGAQLFLYNDDRSFVLGAFTQQNNKAHGGFATDFVPGEATTLEYYEPAGAEPGRLHIATAMQGWPRPAGAAKGAGTSDYTPTSLSCSFNVACSESEGWGDWADVASAVVKISNGCTGVLLNNVNEDEAPYVLTANHCGSPAAGDTLNWVFKFNYQSATCPDPTNTPSSQSISGAVVRAASDGIADFALLELLELIPLEYGVYFAGWSLSDTAPANGAVIGHPQSDIKKITIDDDPLVHYGSTRWAATFDHGTIEGGSSGSPLFNPSHQFIGHVKNSLQLDPDACSGPGGDDNNAIILFPKLNYIWNIGAVGERVSDFLDPNNTGTSNVSAHENTGSNLPVELALFQATLDGQAVELRWKTVSETNNAGFEVQSFSKDDGGQWRVLGYVEGHGTTIEAQSYTYRADNLLAGTYRFRLKQIDFDGAFEYSPEVEVAVGIPTSYHLSPAYPNPFNPKTQFSLSVARAQQVQVAVYDVVGRRVALLFDGLMEAQTTHAFAFEAGSLPSGLYLVRVQSEYFVTSQTITLLK